MMDAGQKERLDVASSVKEDHKVNGHGKNFKPLVAAGAWEISGFHYGKSKCACCGRPITRVLHLKNTAHEAALERDVEYPFSEEIHIGVVCGPKVFLDSCVTFYTDPEKEWLRQWSVWKQYVSFIMLCVQNKDIWNAVPEPLRKVVDHYLEVGWQGESTTGNWWKIRDAKKKILRTKRDSHNRPYVNYLHRNIKVMTSIASYLRLISGVWTVTYNSTGLEVRQDGMIV